MARHRKKKEPEEERGVPESPLTMASLDPPEPYGPRVEITVEVNGKPVLRHPDLYKLFPHRTPIQLEEMRNTIARHGQGGKVLLLDKRIIT